jgi:cytoplasmic iron level regulating protein YaaA (DUF328/UPF0246 family)
MTLLKGFSKSQLKKFMVLSEKLTDETYNHIQAFELNNPTKKIKQALFAYTGAVFSQIKPETFSKKALVFSQSNIRVLSGLYGVLKPLDLIQPYRLEMAKKLKTNRGVQLVDFWKTTITNSLNEDEKEIIINLASKEYLKAIQAKALKAQMIHIHFKEKKGDNYKVVGFFAKQARGKMVNFIVNNKITTPALLKSYHEDDYAFNPSLSSKFDWVFTRG